MTSHAKLKNRSIGGEVRALGGPTTWTMILQYKYVERVVHDVKIYELRRKISSGDEIAYAARRSVGVKMYLYLIQTARPVSV